MIKDSHQTIEAREKMSLDKIKKGIKPPSRLGIPNTEKQKRKISETQKRLGHKPIPQYGENNPSKRPDVRKKISLANTGINNANWKGGLSFQTYTIDWTKTLRRSIRERDNYTCQLNGELQNDKAFPIHHIDYNKKNCSPNNLITLCRKCHTKTNYNREYWKNYFINLIITKYEKD